MSIFFFKQKTAYEMRISDWSSDVCSSDLGLAAGVVVAVAGFFSIRMQMWGMGTFGMLVAAAGSIIAALLFMVGFSAAGTSLLDQARGIAQRPFGALLFAGEIGRASCRERVCQSV